MSTVELSASSLYAVKESHNLAMVSSGSAVATLLNASVWITNPEASVSRIMDFIYAEVSPSVFVKITYTGDRTGSSVLIFRQEDVQLMLCQLMGRPLVAVPDFEFDDINTSAFNEVINQMMTSYFTELSGLTGFGLAVVEAEVITSGAGQNIFALMNLSPDDNICSVSAGLRIDNAVNSMFITVFSDEFAAEIAQQTESRFPMPEEPEIPVEDQLSSMPDFSSSPEESNPFDTTGADENQSIFAMSPDESAAFGAALDQPNAFTGLAEQNSSFSSFNTISDEQLRNLQLLMNVPLELAIEIGSTHKRVDEILSFSHGTVIELDSAADAPVNVIVNGHLIAKGDVVVVDDYFAVRITEIVKSDLLDSLSGN